MKREKPILQALPPPEDEPDFGSYTVRGRKELRNDWPEIKVTSHRLGNVALFLGIVGSIATVLVALRVFGFI